METSEILRQLGRKIKAIREEKGMTQLDLAAMCNFETSNMSRIEAGKSNFTVGTLNKIATSLDISINDLF